MYQNMSTTPLITILVPCYNEEQSLLLLYKELSRVIERLKDYAFELLFVNDGSRDNTLSILRQLHDQDTRCNFVSLSRNFGKENAMLAGFDYAKGDAVIIMDADLQHPPMLIEEMLRIWNHGEVQDVYARRKSEVRESFVRGRLRRMYYRMLDRSQRFEMLHDVGDFRLLDRQAVNAMRSLRESERYTKGMYCFIGFNKQEITYEQAERVAGKSKFNFFSLAQMAINGMTSFSMIPLRIMCFCGGGAAFAAMLAAIYYLIKAIVVGDPVAGFPTLIITVLFFGGVQLFAIGVLGEYIGRIFNEVKHRPVYIAQEYNGSPIEDCHKMPV